MKTIVEFLQSLIVADLSGADLAQVDICGANLNKNDLRKVKSLGLTQIKLAQNWMLATYDPEIDSPQERLRQRLLKTELLTNKAV